MPSHRITFTIPERLHKQMTIAVPPGKVSQFISEAVEEHLANYDPQARKDAIEAFRALRYTIPPERRMTHGQIEEAIKKGRQ